MENIEVVKANIPQFLHDDLDQLLGGNKDSALAYRSQVVVSALASIVRNNSGKDEEAKAAALDIANALHIFDEPAGLKS